MSSLSGPYRTLPRPVTVVAREEPFGTHYRVKGYPFDGTDQFAFTTDLTLRGKRVLLDLGARPARAPVAGAPGVAPEA